jgi:hypothetical protein
MFEQDKREVSAVRGKCHMYLRPLLSWITLTYLLTCMSVLSQAASPLLSPSNSPGADTPGPALKYETDRRVYKAGDVVHITVTNVSDVATPIVDRPSIEEEFAVLEIKTPEGDWRPVKLESSGNSVRFRLLPPGEQHEYLWPTVSAPPSDHPAADPGTYRIGFGRPFYTNPFELTDQ